MLKYLLLAATILSAAPAIAEVQEYRVLSGGNDVGHLKANVEAQRVAIDYDYKNNGRGPTIAEVIALDAEGYPVRWDIDGATTFGNKVDESFAREGGTATWRDATGEGQAAGTDARFYVPQNGSPWSLALLARALLADEDRSMVVLPGGTASLVARETMTFEGPDGPVAATMYELSGLDLNPSYLALDPEGKLFALASPRFAIVRAGYAAADQQLQIGRAHV